MKRALALLAAAITTAAWAQNPDVSIKFDGRLDYRVPNGGTSTQRLYDTLGNPSLLQLSFTLEPGLRAFVSQRLQRIAHDGDPDLLEEYFIEDQGVWRLGKQIVPFGGGAFLREAVLAARGDVDLPLEGTTLAVAVADAGRDRQRGVVGRLAFLDGDVGLSAAVGDHWGISGSSFDLFRRPESSPGVGGGLKKIFGIDATRVVGDFRLRGEFIEMSGAATRDDPTGSALDLSATITPGNNRAYTFGWTRSPGRGDFYRLMGSFETIKHIYIEPMVRLRNGVGYDFSIQLHVRF